MSEKVYIKIYLVFWFACFSSFPFLALILGYGKAFSHIPPAFFHWCSCVVVVAAWFGARNGDNIFLMNRFDRKEYWLAAKTGIVIAAKTALTSAIIISVFYPLIAPNNTELAVPVVMLVSFLYFLFGFVVFSWLILGFGAIGGIALLFMYSFFSQRKKRNNN